MNNMTPPGILTGPNLISCIGELSLQDSNDLTHSTQIATNSADRVGSRYANSSKWLDEYVSTLDFLGWSVFDGAIFTRTRHTVSSSVADILVQSAERMQDRRQANAMIDTLDALRPDQPAIYSLDQESQLGNRFQVMPARYDSKGYLQTAVFNIELVAHEKRSNFLFWNWQERSVEIIQQTAYFRLNKDTLQKKRAQMDEERAKIRMRRFDLIKSR